LKDAKFGLLRLCIHRRLDLIFRADFHLIFAPFCGEDFTLLRLVFFETRALHLDPVKKGCPAHGFEMRQ